MTSPVSAVEAIEKAMESVTSGPWTFWVDTDDGGREYAATVLGPNINDGGFPVVADIPPRTMHGTHGANAAYIAFCNPVAMREVLAVARQAEALERENAELREALRPFALLADELSIDMSGRPDERPVWGFNDAELTYGAFRRTRALLGGSENAGN